MLICYGNSWISLYPSAILSIVWLRVLELLSPAHLIVPTSNYQVKFMDAVVDEPDIATKIATFIGIKHLPMSFTFSHIEGEEEETGLQLSSQDKTPQDEPQKFSYNFAVGSSSINNATTASLESAGTGTGTGSSAGSVTVEYERPRQPKNIVIAVSRYYLWA